MREDHEIMLELSVSILSCSNVRLETETQQSNIHDVARRKIGCWDKRQTRIILLNL